MRHSDSDGSDTFWPGYVDAVTNLVLNLLFLLTIMTVAVFMFALELGRASKGGSDPKLISTTKQDPLAVSKTKSDPAKENIALKLEIQRLNMELAQHNLKKTTTTGGIVKTIDVSSNVKKPESGLEKTITSDSEVRVRFTAEGVAFTQQEHDKLLENLKSFTTSEKVSIFVEVPPGFSEAKRMGFYRVMAVRNLLLEMKVPKERIDVSVREGKNTSNASIVRVRPN